MANPVKPTPEGYHSITPALTCKDADKAIEFYKKAFGAQEIVRMPSPDGKISHEELRIGDSIILVSDEFPGIFITPTASLPSSSLFLYVPDVDSVYKQAIAAGAVVAMPLQDMFWGDRFGKVTDPFGHHWDLATHTEDVAPEEMERRARSYSTKAASQS
jgi:PhnB protein